MGPDRRILLLALLLGGCAAGPDYRTPAAPAGTGYTRDELPQRTAAAPGRGGASQRLVAGLDIPGQWWTLFRSPALDRLVERALRQNADLQAARAGLRAAQELARAQLGAYYPSLQAGFAPSRQKNPVGTLAPTLSSGDAIYTLYTAQLSVSYVPDLFGANRRQVESLRAQAEMQAFQVQATYLALTANVVASAIQEASLRAQLDAASESVRLQREAVGLYRAQFDLGAIAGLDLAAQEAALAQAEAGLPALEKQLAQTRSLLTALCGSPAADEIPERFELDGIELPVELPVSLPGRLVRQRPDVRAAEANLHAATAQVGVAVANLLPQVALSAALGTTGTRVDQLFTPFNAFWSVGASLSQTLFDGGTLLHRRRAADALMDQAGAQYRSTVINALQNVADALRALDIDARALRAAVDAEAANRRSLDYTRSALELGSTSHLALILARQAHEQSVAALAQARAARLADTAALFQALGGGWWNRPPVEGATAP